MAKRQLYQVPVARAAFMLKKVESWHVFWRIFHFCDYISLYTTKSRGTLAICCSEAVTKRGILSNLKDVHMEILKLIGNKIIEAQICRRILKGIVSMNLSLVKVMTQPLVRMNREI
ncbi:uncharacterized protein ZBAI_09267 [Zygosaccharomyces bailii ISA1307]|nr:uncharacterized protein ZBAI_09267 [Zygosaccharomyces bailii ISA1307]